MSEFTVRPPRADESSAVAEVHVQCWRETYAALLPSEYLERDLLTPRIAMWDQILASPGEARAVAVAERDGGLIGLAAAGDPLDGPGPRPLQLYLLYLLATEHGSGAGQALLDAVIADRPAFLWVAEPNPRAQSFYRRNGFRPDGSSIADELGITEVRLVR